MSNFTNGLNPAEEERIQCLAEEAAEIVQACMKVLRHGYGSINPDDPSAIDNRGDLCKEIGNFKYVLERMSCEGDLRNDIISQGYAGKALSWVRYTHHQPEIQ